MILTTYEDTKKDSSYPLSVWYQGIHLMGWTALPPLRFNKGSKMKDTTQTTSIDFSDPKAVGAAAEREMEQVLAEVGDVDPNTNFAFDYKFYPLKRGGVEPNGRYFSILRKPDGTEEQGSVIHSSASKALRDCHEEWPDIVLAQGVRIETELAKVLASFFCGMRRVVAIEKQKTRAFAIMQETGCDRDAAMAKVKKMDAEAVANESTKAEETPTPVNPAADEESMDVFA